MPKLTRSIEEVNAVREQILDCAFDILATHGYENLSMARIGTRMKMTAANLYNYFANKDELLISIHKKAHNMLYSDMKEAVDSAGSSQERYEKMSFAFVTFATHNINIYDIMFNRPVKQHSDYIGTPQEELSYEEFQSSLKINRLMMDTIREYQNTHGYTEPADNSFLALQYFSTLHGIVSLYNSGVLKQMHEDPDAVLKSVILNTMQLVLG